MKFIINNINAGLFVYFIISVISLLFVFSDAKATTFCFITLRDFGNILGAVAITFLVYNFSKESYNDQKFVIIKKIYQAMLILMLINFSKTIAGMMIDLMQIVQLTFFSNSTVINNIINKIR